MKVWMNAVIIAAVLCACAPRESRAADAIDEFVTREMQSKRIPGIAFAVVQHDQVTLERAYGLANIETGTPVRTNGVFEIASVTKPFTATAVMMLVEEGKLDLAAPVHQYLPELKNMQVAEENADATGKLVLEPPKRPMTILDLLRHTSGLLYAEEGTTLAHRRYRNAVFRRDKTLADFTSSLAELPLGHQPGEVWEYSFAMDVLARVIEVASGLPYDEFLETRLFQPLHMVDTGFYVPEAKLDRLVDPPPGGRPALWDLTKKPKLFSGGGGLASTAVDYLRFCQMLLNGGELDGVRILALETVRQMTTNSLPPDTRFAGFVGSPWGSTWGLGFAIRTSLESSLVPGSVGTFTWGGVWGTRFWIDPVQRLIAVQMIQVSPDEIARYSRTLRYLTYAAIRTPDQDTSVSPIIRMNSDPGEFSVYAGHYYFGNSVSAIDKNGPPAVTYSGLGIDFGMEDGLAKVRSVFTDGPAAQAGMIVGDTITDIDNVPVKGLATEQVISKLRGPPNTDVRIKIARKNRDNLIDITLTRTPIMAPSLAQLKVKVRDGSLLVEAVGPLPVLDFNIGQPKAMVQISNGEFYINGGDHTRIAFVKDGSGKVSGAVLNAGQWEIRGRRKE